MYGHLKVYCGPMFSGKTSALLRDFLWLQHSGENVKLIKPSFDTRWHIEKITTHTGLSAEATCVNDVRNLFSEYDAKYFLFDEVQFFDPHLGVKGDVIMTLKELLQNGKNVIACGLDMDWKGDPFYITASLLAMADEVHKLQSICTFSGLPASKTYKKLEHRDNDASVELGASNIYEARNNRYFGE